MKTTLNQIKSYKPCESGWETLTAYLGPDFPMDKEFPVSEIVKSNGINDTFWLLKRIMKDEPLKKLSVEFACDCAERGLPIYEASYLDNKAPQKAIEAAREWLQNPCERTEDAAAKAAADAAYAAYAAKAAAYAAADAAADAANAAAKAAADAADAADAATYAANAAAYAADAGESEWQKNRLIELLEAEA